MEEEGQVIDFLEETIKEIIKERDLSREYVENNLKEFLL